MLVLWWRDVPLGQVEVSIDPMPPGWQRWLVARAVAPAALERLRPGAFGNWLPGRRGDPGDVSAQDLVSLTEPLAALDQVDALDLSTVDTSEVSVVICTRGPTRIAQRTLDALRRQRHAPARWWSPTTHRRATPPATSCAATPRSATYGNDVRG